MQSHFASEFDVAVADYSRVPDHTYSAEGAGSRATMVVVKPWGGRPWMGSFASRDPGLRALTARLATPSPTGLCVVERGTVFLGDVLEPESFEVVSQTGPVVTTAELVAEAVLVLVTPWVVTAVGESGLLWSTLRISIDGMRVEGASDGWLWGVADPDDDEPRDFAVELGTGRVVGGFSVA